MNSRNIFCLSKFSSKHRRGTADPFEHDPFKIQSYNFRYADRPSYPVNILPSKVKRQDCQTFFFNNDFERTNVPLNLTKFQETRRRQFLQDLRTNGNSLITGTKENFVNNKQKIGNKNLSNVYNKTEIFNSSITENEEKSQNSPSINQNLNISANTLTKSLIIPGATVSNPSNNSCCEINIKIKNLQHNSLPDNVNIKIETDSISRNLNLPLKKSTPNGFKFQINSSNSFIVNKKLSKNATKSKFNIKDLRKSESQRVKVLTSLYSSQNLKKSFRSHSNKSNEKLPSLIPFNAYNSSLSQENIIPKRSWSQKLKEHLKVYDSKATTSNSNNNFYQSPYNSATVGRGPKVLNTCNNSKKFNNSRQPPLVSSLHSLPSSEHKNYFKSTVPLRLRSKTQMPLNVNINVYATDKLR